MPYREFDPLAETLRALPPRVAPGELTDRLRVLASQESLRRRRRSSLRALLSWWRESLSLFFNNLMKPVAVPMFGGLVSTIILFSVLAPSYPIQRPVTGDVPSPIFTEPMVRSSLSLPAPDENIVVDVWIDEQGRVLDYSIPGGQPWASDPSLVRSVENTLVHPGTRFTPATVFGQPASSKLRVIFSRRSQVDVRG
jgi:hypothetical protein